MNDPKISFEVRAPLGEALLGDGAIIPKFDDSRFKDVPFSVLFAINVITVTILAFTSGISSLNFGGVNFISNSTSKTDLGMRGEVGKIVGGLFLVLFIGGTLSLGWIHFLSRSALQAVNVIFGVLLTMNVIGGFSLLFSGQFLYGLLLLFGAVIGVFVWKMMRPQIEFASIYLMVACEAIKMMPSTILAAAIVLGVQLLFCFLWMLALMGVATNEGMSTISAGGMTYKLSDCVTVMDSLSQASCMCKNLVVKNRACVTPTMYGGPYFVMLMSLFWTSIVLTNVVHCTTAGAVAGWWIATDLEIISFSDTEIEYDLTSGQSNSRFKQMCTAANSFVSAWLGVKSTGYQLVRTSLIRSLTTSFGSICLGSLLVTLLRSIRMLVGFITRRLKALHSATGLRAGSTLQMCILLSLDFLATQLERAMSYFNRYAFCFVALYGTDFITSSRSVVKMFDERGYSILLNDNIIDAVLFFGNISGAVLCMLSALCYSRVARMSPVNTYMLSSFGMFSGYFIFCLATEVVSSAVAAVCVCFADRPHVLEATHMSCYIGLERSWMKLLRGAEPLSASFSIFSKEEQGGEEVERSGAWLERGKSVTAPTARSAHMERERENGNERGREREREGEVGGWSRFGSQPSAVNQTNPNPYRAVRTASSGINAHNHDSAAYSAYRPVFNNDEGEEGDRERERERDERSGSGMGMVVRGEMKRDREERPNGTEHKSGPSIPAATSTSTSTSTSSAQQMAVTALHSIANMLPFRTDTHINTNTDIHANTDMNSQVKDKNNEMDGRQNGDEETVTF